MLRDGSPQEVDTNSLVVGDIVTLETGDKIPADIVVLSSDSLTGELVKHNSIFLLFASITPHYTALYRTPPHCTVLHQFHSLRKFASQHGSTHLPPT